MNEKERQQLSRSLFSSTSAFTEPPEGQLALFEITRRNEEVRRQAQQTQTRLEPEERLRRVRELLEPLVLSTNDQEQLAALQEALELADA